MQEVGKLLHVAGSGRAIVRLAAPVSERQVLYDSRGRPAARVSEVMGPVSAPYASAVPLGGPRAARPGAALYAGPEEGRGRRRRA